MLKLKVCWAKSQVLNYPFQPAVKVNIFHNIQSFTLSFSNPHPSILLPSPLSFSGSLTYPPRNKITVICGKQEASLRHTSLGIKGTTRIGRHRAQELLPRTYLYPFGISWPTHSLLAMGFNSRGHLASVRQQKWPIHKAASKALNDNNRTSQRHHVPITLLLFLLTHETLT